MEGKNWEIEVTRGGNGSRNENREGISQSSFQAAPPLKLQALTSLDAMPRLEKGTL